MNRPRPGRGSVAALLASLLLLAHGRPAQGEELHPMRAVLESLAQVTTAEADRIDLAPSVAVGGGAAFQGFGYGSMPDNRSNALIDDRTSGALQLQGNWRFHRHFATALTAGYATGWKYLQTEPGPRELTQWTVTADLKAYPLLRKWQPFFLAGVGFGQAISEGEIPVLDPNSGLVQRSRNVGKEGFVARFGIGMDAPLTIHWHISGEVAYVLGTGDLEDYGFTTMTMALRYIFF